MNMTTAQIIEKKLEMVVKDSVKEAVEAQFVKLRAFLVQDVSAEEQKEIELKYRMPSKKPAKSFRLAL